MKYLSAVLFMGFLSLSVLIAGCDQIDDSKKVITEGIEIVNPYAFATAESAKTGAVFMEIVNHGPEDDVLIGVSSKVANVNEIHESFVDEGGMMMMRKIGGIEIAAGTATTLEPGGLHLMLIDLQKQLKEGKNFKMTLQFEKAGEVSAKVVISKPGTAPAGHHDHSHHGHDHEGHDHGHHDHAH